MQVKFGTPHVVDLGQELEFAPQANGNGDRTPRLYVVADGATDPWAPQTWMQGSETYLAVSDRDSNPDPSPHCAESDPGPRCGGDSGPKWNQIQR